MCRPLCQGEDCDQLAYSSSLTTGFAGCCLDNKGLKLFQKDLIHLIDFLHV